MAHLQSRAMPQEGYLREHGTTLSLCVKVGKARVFDSVLQIREGGGRRGGDPDPEVRGGPVPPYFFLRPGTQGPFPGSATG